MTLRMYIHSIAKRAEITALVDSGATENFLNLSYAKWLRLPIKRLLQPRKLYNVDGTQNKSGELQYYTDLVVQTGTSRTNMRFFLTDLGDHKAILGYPWFAANQPRIDWKRGWIDHSQLPIIARAANAGRATFGHRLTNHPTPSRMTDRHFIGRVTIGLSSSEPDNDTLPAEYQRHKKIFSEAASQRLPGFTIWDHAIELSDGAPSTLPGRLLPLTQKEIEECHSFVEEHLRRGTIRESKSPYAANFFFVKKKDGKLRPVQDYRPLNKWTVRNRNVSPLIPQVIDRLAGCTLFTKFDVRWGYNNIRIKKGDEWKAAFLTPEGLFEPLVMFFGLTNSPATFQTMMNTIFRPHVRRRNFSIYMDDGVIHTSPLPHETDEEHLARHRKIVHEIFDILAQNDLYLKPEKCLFEQNEIDFLGVMVGAGTIRMDPGKIKTVQDWPTPRTPTNVRAFLGFTGYYRYFIPGYSATARPLLELTKKHTPFHWDQAQEKSFRTLQQAMCTSPVLFQPDYSRQFYLQTDASAYGLGAVLSQEHPSEKKGPTAKPKLHPVAYYSATFTPTERNYDIYERELLAIMKALNHWRSYLGWTVMPFIILTDHANLQYWKAPQNLTRRTARWHADLQEYDYILKYIPGKENVPSDFLSRPPLADKGDTDNQAITMIPGERIAATRATIEVPPVLEVRRGLLHAYHDHPIAGHPGRDETLRQLRVRYHWPRMKEWVANYIKGCGVCQQNKILTHRAKTPLYRIGTLPNARPFECIAMDLITGLPMRKGIDAILTIVDQGCSRAALFLPCSATTTGPQIAQLYLDNVYRWFGLPTKMISDRDPRFTSHFGQALAKKLGVRQNLSTAFHPQTDGLSERKNQWVEQYLRLVTSLHPEDWTRWLSVASAVHNNRRNATTGLSPNQVLLGYEPTLSPLQSPATLNDTAETRIKEMLDRRKEATEALNRVANNPKPLEDQYQVGDYVWLEATHLRFLHHMSKLTPKRYGPFRISAVISPVAFRLELPVTWRIHNVFHATLLSPYHETPAHGTNFSRPPPDLVDGVEEQEVESILGYRLHGRTRKPQYLVAWKGFPASDNEWVWADHVHAPHLVKAYHRRHPVIKRTTIDVNITPPPLKTCRPHRLICPTSPPLAQPHLLDLRPPSSIPPGDARRTTISPPSLQNSKPGFARIPMSPLWGKRSSLSAPRLSTGSSKSSTDRRSLSLPDRPKTSWIQNTTIRSLTKSPIPSPEGWSVPCSVERKSTRTPSSISAKTSAQWKYVSRNTRETTSLPRGINATTETTHLWWSPLLTDSFAPPTGSSNSTTGKWPCLTRRAITPTPMSLTSTAPPVLMTPIPFSQSPPGSASYSPDPPPCSINSAMQPQSSTTGGYWLTSFDSANKTTRSHSSTLASTSTRPSSTPSNWSGVSPRVDWRPPKSTSNSDIWRHSTADIPFIAHAMAGKRSREPRTLPLREDSQANGRGDVTGTRDETYRGKSWEPVHGYYELPEPGYDLA